MERKKEQILHIHCIYKCTCIYQKITEIIPSYIDNLHIGLKYLMILFYKIRVDIYIKIQPHYTHIFTYPHISEINSYIYTCI